MQLSMVLEEEEFPTFLKKNSLPPTCILLIMAVKYFMLYCYIGLQTRGKAPGKPYGSPMLVLKSLGLFWNKSFTFEENLLPPILYSLNKAC